MIRAPKSEANELGRQRHETRSSLLPTLKTRGRLIQAKRSCAFCPPLPVHETDYSGLLKNRTMSNPKRDEEFLIGGNSSQQRSALHPVGFILPSSSNPSFLAASSSQAVLKYRLPLMQCSQYR